MKSLLTILLTSLFWLFFIWIFFEPKDFIAKDSDNNSLDKSVVEQVQTTESATSKKPRKQGVATKGVQKTGKSQTSAAKERQPEATTENKPNADSSTARQNSSSEPIQLTSKQELFGLWEPIEGAQYPIEFTKYNVAIQNRGYQRRIQYSIVGGRTMQILYDNAKFTITQSGENVYLEIFNSTDFSGRYKRVSQPKEVVAAQLPLASFPEKIVGHWKPICGQEYSIEFSKYGTAIQKRGFDRRIEYSIKGNQLFILYDKAYIAISEGADYYYLEIFNSADFAGQYRKSK